MNISHDSGCARFLGVFGGRNLPCFFFFQAEDGIRDKLVTGVQTCALLLIMSPYADAAFLEEHSAADTPAVLMNTPVRGYGHSAFCIDNRGGARVMVSHLASVGHRRIAFISGPADNFDATERLAGYREALRELGLEAGERVLPGDFSEESGYRAAQSLLTPQGREWPDAVFAANDMMALGSLFAFNEAHVGVPADIALAGEDHNPPGPLL